jgi:hypothetical protein
MASDGNKLVGAALGVAVAVMVSHGHVTATAVTAASHAAHLAHEAQLAKPSAPVVTTAVSGCGGSNVALANCMATAAGWGSGQVTCLDELWTRESGFSTTATNPSSGAYGIPQSLPAGKMAAAGADWQTNPRTQVRWGISYITGRYGSACAAWSHEMAVSWY